MAKVLNKTTAHIKRGHATHSTAEIKCYYFWQHKALKFSIMLHSRLQVQVFGVTIFSITSLRHLLPLWELQALSFSKPWDFMATTTGKWPD